MNVRQLKSVELLIGEVESMEDAKTAVNFLVSTFFPVENFYIDGSWEWNPVTKEIYITFLRRKRI